jgi:hypothetical protein
LQVKEVKAEAKTKMNTDNSGAIAKVMNVTEEILA